ASPDHPDKAVAHEAHPEVHREAPIDLVQVMARARRQIPIGQIINGVPRKNSDQRSPEIGPIELIAHVAEKPPELLQSVHSYGKSLRSVWPRAAVWSPHQSRPQCYQAPLESQPAVGA